MNTLSGDNGFRASRGLGGRSRWSDATARTRPGKEVEMSHYDVEHADLYRGRILANLRHYWFTGWHWVYLAPGFCTVGNCH